MAEAAVAYFSHNFGDLISEVATGARVWAEAAVTNAGFFVMQVAEGLRDTIATTVSFVSELPQRLLDQGEREKGRRRGGKGRERER